MDESDVCICSVLRACHTTMVLCQMQGSTCHHCDPTQHLALKRSKNQGRKRLQPEATVNWRKVSAVGLHMHVYTVCGDGLGCVCTHTRTCQQLCSLVKYEYDPAKTSTSAYVRGQNVCWRKPL